MTTFSSRLAGDWHNGPWRSKSVWVALAVFLVGTGLWLVSLAREPSPPRGGVTTVRPPAPATAAATPSTDLPPANGKPPFPGYAWVSVSYAAAYSLGWLFRRLLRLLLTGVGLILALLALGKFVGWDTRRASDRVQRGGERLQVEMTAVSDRLRQLLPSATAAGVGGFLGFRRRAKSVPSSLGTPGRDGRA